MILPKIEGYLLGLQPLLWLLLSFTEPYAVSQRDNVIRGFETQGLAPLSWAAPGRERWFLVGGQSRLLLNYGGVGPHINVCVTFGSSQVSSLHHLNRFMTSRTLQTFPLRKLKRMYIFFSLCGFYRPTLGRIAKNLEWGRLLFDDKIFGFEYHKPRLWLFIVGPIWSLGLSYDVETHLLLKFLLLLIVLIQ